MAKQVHTPHFHIAFDTNFLISEAENRLLNTVASEFILEANKTQNPKVTWHLLDTVRAERRHQMLLVALKLLTQVDKVGRLLGKDFKITRSSLEEGIDAVIKAEVAKHGLNIQKLNTVEVDWPALIERSTARKPPFEDVGKYEKGFRDSIILETFSQVVERLSGHKGHRFVLVTGDDCLTTAIDERMKVRGDVLVVKNIQDLKSLLNASASHISESDLETLLKNANDVFYIEGDKNTLFYKWEIETRIRKELPLFEPPPNQNVTSVSATLASVGPTSFLKKADDVLTFTSYVDFGVTAMAPFNLSGAGGTVIYIPGMTTGTFSTNLDTGFSTSTTTLNLPSASPTAGTYFISNNLYPGAGFTRATTSAAYPSTGIILPGSSGPTNYSTGLAVPRATYPDFVQQGGRKIVEIEWSAVSAGGELKEPKLLSITLLAAEW